MRIGVMINNIEKELASYTTIGLAKEATHRGHEVLFMQPGDLSYVADETISAMTFRVGQRAPHTREDYLKALKSEHAVRERITLDNLDIMLLRNDPADDIDRPWAQTSGIFFGRFLAQRGVLVLNDPGGLEQALNKLYFQYFPETVRPKSLISRDVEEIRAFAEAEGDVVLKPLQGSHGKNVFVVKKKERSNLKQIVEAIMRDGYVIVQEYLPAAKEGDIRLFLVNGYPLVYEGVYAALRRVPKNDVRSNITVGGTAQLADIGPRELRLAELIRPKLIQDGMFFVGIDIAGDKLMEINVFSPGGLPEAEELCRVKFSAAFIDILERKAQCRALYRGQFDNRTLAMI